MNTAELLTDAFNRIDEEVRDVLNGLATQTMNTQPAAERRERSNSISWLIWHLSRVQDDHLAGVVGTEQLWTQGGFAERAGYRSPLAIPATDITRMRRHLWSLKDRSYSPNITLQYTR